MIRSLARQPCLNESTMLQINKPKYYFHNYEHHEDKRLFALRLSIIFGCHASSSLSINAPDLVADYRLYSHYCCYSLATINVRIVILGSTDPWGCTNVNSTNLECSRIHRISLSSKFDLFLFKRTGVLFQQTGVVFTRFLRVWISIAMHQQRPL